MITVEYTFLPNPDSAGYVNFNEARIDASSMIAYLQQRSIQIAERDIHSLTIRHANNKHRIRTELIMSGNPYTSRLHTWILQ